MNNATIKNTQKTNNLSDLSGCNWSWVKLSDVYKIETGNTPPKKESDNYGNYIPFIKPPQLMNCIVVNGEESLSKKGSEKGRVLPIDSILVSCIGNLGKVGLNKVPVAFNQQINALIYNPKIYSKFTYYFCQSNRFRNQLESVASATTITIVNKFKFSQLTIPLPPLPEQKKIVEKIEELFSGLDSGVASLKKAKEQIRLYRQSVLASAFSGKLIGNGKIDEKTGLPKGWKWVKLGIVCDKIQDGSHFSPQKSYNQKAEGRYLYITSKNIRNNYLDLDNITYVDSEFHNSIFPRCNPEFGDVLLTKDGANTGNVTINTLKEEFSLLSSVCLIKPNRQKINSHFIKYYLQSPSGFKAVTGAMTGTAIKRIILRTIKDADMILPPLAQQTQIVSEIEKRFSEADNLEKAIDDSLKKSESLRQSILKQAFEGRLV